MTTSQELDRAQERADKTAADLRRTEAELRVTRVSIATLLLLFLLLFYFLQDFLFDPIVFRSFYFNLIERVDRDFIDRPNSKKILLKYAI